MVHLAASRDLLALEDLRCGILQFIFSADTTGDWDSLVECGGELSCTFVRSIDLELDVVSDAGR